MSEEIELTPWICPKCKEAVEVGWFRIYSDGTFLCVKCSNEGQEQANDRQT